MRKRTEKCGDNYPYTKEVIEQIMFGIVFILTIIFIVIIMPILFIVYMVQECIKH